METRWGERQRARLSYQVQVIRTLGRQRQLRTGSQRLATLEGDFKDLPLVLRTGMVPDASGLVEGICHTSVTKKLWLRGPKFNPDWEEDIEGLSLVGICEGR